LYSIILSGAPVTAWKVAGPLGFGSVRTQFFAHSGYLTATAPNFQTQIQAQIDRLSSGNAAACKGRRNAQAMRSKRTGKVREAALKGMENPPMSSIGGFCRKSW